MFAQLGQLLLQVRAAHRQKEPLALLQDLIELRLMLRQTSLQPLADRAFRGSVQRDSGGVVYQRCVLPEIN